MQRLLLPGRSDVLYLRIARATSAGTAAIMIGSALQLAYMPMVRKAYRNPKPSTNPTPQTLHLKP